MSFQMSRTGQEPALGNTWCGVFSCVAALYQSELLLHRAEKL